jgi:hypothetical protein
LISSARGGDSGRSREIASNGSLNSYSITPSLYTEHTFYFGDTHLLNRGKQQALYESLMPAAIDKGMRPTNHTDFIVAPLDQMFVIWTAVNRISRSGVVIGPEQRVTPVEALKAITINAAYQYGEENPKAPSNPASSPTWSSFQQTQPPSPPTQSKTSRSSKPSKMASPSTKPLLTDPLKHATVRPSATHVAHPFRDKQVLNGKKPCISHSAKRMS